MHDAMRCVISYAVTSPKKGRKRVMYYAPYVGLRRTAPCKSLDLLEMARTAKVLQQTNGERTPTEVPSVRKARFHRDEPPKPEQRGCRRDRSCGRRAHPGAFVLSGATRQRVLAQAAPLHLDRADRSDHPRFASRAEGRRLNREAPCFSAGGASPFLDHRECEA